MSYTHYERLTAIDATFLDIEDENVHMHVGALAIFEGAELLGEDGGLDFARIRRLAAPGLARHRRFRQRLEQVPLVGHPVWVDDARFNLDYHLRHTALPEPGRRAPAQASLRPRDVAEARRAQAALGDVVRRGPLGRALRADHQGAPLHGRRRLGRRADRAADGPGDRGRRASGSRRKAPRRLPGCRGRRRARSDCWWTKRPGARPCRSR